MTIPDEENLLDLIYGAAVQPSLWPDALDRVISAVGADEGSGVLNRMDIETGAGAALAPRGSDSSILKLYFDNFYQINPLQIVSDPASYLADWQPRIVLDEDLLARDCLERSEYYNDFLTKIAVEWGMIIRLGMRGMDVVTISVGRGPRRGRFDQFETAKAARLQPHLIRAYRLSEQFASIRGWNAGAFAGLDDLPAAMIMLDRQGHVLHANKAGEALLIDGNVLDTHNGHLIPANFSLSQPFAGIIARAAGRDWGRSGAGSICVPAQDGGAPLTITATPLPVEHASVFAPRPAVLVCVTDPNIETPTREVRLQRQFALTAAEGRLAASLLDGLSLRAASAKFGVSITTVRTQLAALFAKTDTHRQADLVRRLMQAEAAVPRQR